MKLRIKTEIEVAATPERTFDVAASNDTLVRVLRPYGPIPGIVAMHMHGGVPLAKGAQRHVEMSDGSTLEEEILDHDRPRRARYRWMHAPAGPFGLLIRGAEGDWTFAPSARGTRIAWTYSFELTTPLVAPLALPVLAIFRRWMAYGLLRVAEALRA